MLNPYSGHSFIGFFSVLGQRLFQLFSGEALILASDEVQVIVLVMIALSSALVGTFLVLRKMTMLANSLSHTILLGIVGAFVIVGQSHKLFELTLPILLIGAFIAALCTTFATEFLHKKLRLQEDASIGLIFTAFFALGVVCVTTLSRNNHLGIEAIMGNVDALHASDMKLAFYLFLFNAAVIFLFFRRFEIVAFDGTLAQNVGISLLFCNYLMMFQIALTAIGAFRAIGSFLFLTFLVTPPLTARFFTKRLKPLIFIACGVGTLASLVSVALSRHILSIYQVPLSTSGISSVILGLFFLVGLVYHRRAVR